MSDVKPEVTVQIEIDEMSADELSKKAESYVVGLNKKIDGVEINLESEDINDLQNQLTAINDYRANLDVNTEDYKHATIVATELLRTQQELTDSKTPVLNVDTSQYTDKVQTAISTIQQYNDALNSLEEAKLGGDTSKIDEAQQKVNTLKSTMDTLQSDGTFATIDFTFNAETFKQDIANIKVPDNSLKVTPETDLSKVKDSTKNIKTIIEGVKPKIKPTVETDKLRSNIENKLKSPFKINIIPNGKIQMGTGSYNHLMGSANLEGSAYADGSWTVGKRAGKNTLVGERAPEILVRNGRWQTIGANGAELIETKPDDIIFNDKQAEAILKYGHINSRGKAIGNSSFANGSAFYTNPSMAANGTVVSRNNRYTNTASSNKKKSNSSTTSSTEQADEFLEVMDWIEIKIQRCEEEIERLDKVATNTFTNWSTRTSKLNDEMSATVDEIKWATAGYQEYLDKAKEAIEVLNGTDTVEGSVAKSIKDLKTTLDADIATAKASGDNAQADVDALEAKVGTVHEDKTVVQMIQDAQTAATYDDSEIRGLISDNADAIEAHKTAVDSKVTTLVGDDTNKSVRTIANEELAAQLIPEGAKESLDTLQEIAAWIQSHPDDASAMNQAITALQTLVGTIPEGATATDIVNYIKELVDAEKTRATGVESGLDTRLSAVETLVGEGGSVDDKIATAKQEAIDTAAADATSKANTAETNAKGYADGLNTAMDTRVTSLETKVSEGFEPISESFIRGLFA